jgi:hypothetical protein
MKKIVSTPFCAAMCLVAFLVGSAHAGSATSASGDKPAASARHKTQKGASGQVRFLPGSAETSKDRSRRLKRECQGQVNAGACAGYTR